MENVREELDRLIRQRNVGYSAVSRLLNRNPAYIQQFIKRGSPRKLDDGEVIDLGGKRVRWLDTPNVPHDLNAGLMQALAHRQSQCLRITTEQR